MKKKLEVDLWPLHAHAPPLHTHTHGVRHSKYNLGDGSKPAHKPHIIHNKRVCASDS